MRQRVSGYDVELKAEQCSEPPTVLTRVTIKHKLRGSIQPETVQKAIHLSERNYCSVSAMIAMTAKIKTIFEIISETQTETVSYPTQAKG